MLVLRLFLVAILFPAVTFAFGWAVLTRFTRLDGEERFATAWGVGVGVMALSQFVAFLTRADQTLFNGGATLLMLSVAAYCYWGTRRAGGVNRPVEGSGDSGFHRRVDTPRSPLWPLAALWSLGYVALLGTQALLPVYAGSDWFGDWMMHFETAQIFRGKVDVNAKWIGQYSLASRTPVFNLTTAYVLSLTGDDAWDFPRPESTAVVKGGGKYDNYPHGQAEVDEMGRYFWAYQTASVMLSYCFVAPLYLLLRDPFGPRVGRVALVLAPLNLWMMHLAWFTWPKMLTAYFLLLGLHFYLQYVRLRDEDPVSARRYLLGGWASVWVGFITHQVGLVYILALLTHVLYLALRDRRALWLRPTMLVLLVIVFALIVGPWYGWLDYQYGLSEIRSRTPVTQMDTSTQFTFLNILDYIAYEFATSVFPVALAEALFVSPVTATGVYYGLTKMYFSLAAGAVTLSLLAFLSWAAVGMIGALFVRDGKWRGDDPVWIAVWLFVVYGVVGGLALHPAKISHGCAHAALFPAVILLVGLAWSVLARWPGNLKLVVAGGIVLEFLGMFWTHVWFAVTNPAVLDAYGSNLWTKQNYSAVMITDVVGPFNSIVVFGVLLAQLVFILVLFLWFWPTATGELQPAKGNG